MISEFFLFCFWDLNFYSGLAATLRQYEQWNGKEEKYRKGIEEKKVIRNKTKRK